LEVYWSLIGAKSKGVQLVKLYKYCIKKNAFCPLLIALKKKINFHTRFSWLYEYRRQFFSVEINYISVLKILTHSYFKLCYRRL